MGEEAASATGQGQFFEKFWCGRETEHPTTAGGSYFEFDGEVLRLQLKVGMQGGRALSPTPRLPDVHLCKRFSDLEKSRSRSPPPGEISEGEAEVVVEEGLIAEASTKMNGGVGPRTTTTAGHGGPGGAVRSGSPTKSTTS